MIKRPPVLQALKDEIEFGTPISEIRVNAILNFAPDQWTLLSNPVYALLSNGTLMGWAIKNLTALRDLSLDSLYRFADDESFRQDCLKTEFARISERGTFDGSSSAVAISQLHRLECCPPTHAEIDALVVAIQHIVMELKINQYEKLVEKFVRKHQLEMSFVDRMLCRVKSFIH